MNNIDVTTAGGLAAGIGAVLVAAYGALRKIKGDVRVDKIDDATQKRLREKLVAAGHKIVMDFDHGWCFSVYVRDPNGILVELCADKPGGIPIDPAEALRRMERDRGDRSAANWTPLTNWSCCIRTGSITWPIAF